MASAEDIYLELDSSYASGVILSAGPMVRASISMPLSTARSNAEFFVEASYTWGVGVYGDLEGAEE